MAIGTRIQKARKRLGMSQQELADDSFIHRSLVSKHESGERTCHRENWKDYVKGMDDARFTLDVHAEATGGVYIPYLDGDYVTHDIAALIYLSKREIEIALQHMDDIDASKPATMLSEIEVDHIKKTNKELLDVCAATMTLVIDNCTAHNLSFNQEVKNWIATLKARRLMMRENL